MDDLKRLYIYIKNMMSDRIWEYGNLKYSSLKLILCIADIWSNSTRIFYWPAFLKTHVSRYLNRTSQRTWKFHYDFFLSKKKQFAVDLDVELSDGLTRFQLDSPAAGSSTYQTTRVGPWRVAAWECLSKPKLHSRFWRVDQRVCYT